LAFLIFVVVIPLFCFFYRKYCRFITCAKLAAQLIAWASSIADSMGVEYVHPFSMLTVFILYAVEL